MDKYALWEKLYELSKELNRIPPRDWKEYKMTFWKYKKVQEKYIKAGGSMIDFKRLP